MNPRKRLTHSRLWLGMEETCPTEFRPGVILAIKRIEKARDSFYANTGGCSKHCSRCIEVALTGATMSLVAGKEKRRG